MNSTDKKIVVSLIFLLSVLGILGCNSGNNGGEIKINYTGNWLGEIFFRDDTPPMEFRGDILHEGDYFNGIFYIDGQKGTFLDSQVEGNRLILFIESPVDSLRYVYRGLFQNGQTSGQWFRSNSIQDMDEENRMGSWNLRRRR